MRSCRSQAAINMHFTDKAMSMYCFFTYVANELSSWLPMGFGHLPGQYQNL